jgi:hypothetical protein
LTTPKTETASSSFAVTISKEEKEWIAKTHKFLNLLLKNVHYSIASCWQAFHGSRDFAQRALAALDLKFGFSDVLINIDKRQALLLIPVPVSASKLDIKQYFSNLLTGIQECELMGGVVDHLEVATHFMKMASARLRCFH